MASSARSAAATRRRQPRCRRSSGISARPASYAPRVERLERPLAAKQAFPDDAIFVRYQTQRAEITALLPADRRIGRSIKRRQSGPGPKQQELPAMLSWSLLEKHGC